MAHINDIFKRLNQSSPAVKNDPDFDINNFITEKMNEVKRNNVIKKVGEERNELLKQRKNDINNLINNAQIERQKENRSTELAKQNILPTKDLSIQKLVQNATSKIAPITIKSIVGDTVKGIENLGLGLVNDVIDFKNTIGRRMNEGMTSRIPTSLKMYNDTIKVHPELANDTEFKNKYLKNYEWVDDMHEEYKPKFADVKERNLKKIEENANNSSNPISKYLNQNIAPAIGGMLPAVATGGGGALVYMAGSSNEKYLENAKQRGMDDREAKYYAAKMSLADTLTGMLPLGQILKTGSNVSKQALSQTLKDIGIAGLEEGVQEAIMEPIGELFAGKKYANWDNMGSRMISSAVAGGLVGTIMSGAGAGIGSATNVLNKINSGQDVTLGEINRAISDSKANGIDVNETFKANAKNAINEFEVENSPKTEYNSAESEVDSNGGYKQNNGRIISGNDETTRLHEKKENYSTREYSWGEYNKWEQSIKPVESNKLTETERQSVSKAKSEYNKDIILYDENNNDNTYSGGASKQNKNKITISREQAKNFGLDMMIHHENVESDILHNDNAKDILLPVIDMIVKDSNFNLQKEKFWINQDENIPNDKLIAKDMICDRFAEIQLKQKMDYENVLSNETNSTIDMALSNYYNKVYGKELDINNTSSFILPVRSDVKTTNKKIDSATETNETILPSHNVQNEQRYESY